MEKPTPLPHHVLTRRELLVATAAGLGTAAAAHTSVSGASHVAGAGTALVMRDGGTAFAALGTPQTAPAPTAGAPVSVAPWTDYFGAVQDTPAWSSAQRGGRVADADGSVRPHVVREILQAGDLLSWAAPHPSQRTAEGVTEFMNLVRSTNGAWWRDQLFRYTVGLIDVHKTTANRVIGIQLGNEISAYDYRVAIEQWARSVGLRFPHPRSNYNDRGWYQRDHIGYFAEYFLAPAVQGIRAANAKALAADRIPIVLGSVVGVRDAFVRNHFIPALLNYRIDGAFAPALRGKRVKDVVDYMSIHYLLTPENIFGYSNGHGVPLPYGSRKALSDMHTRWVGNARIKGVWHTEEGGVLAQAADQHASLAVRVFGRTMSWAIDGRVPPSQLKIFGMYKPPADGWGEYKPRWETSWSCAMSVLHKFLGHDTRLINRSPGVSADVTDPTENYGFETSDRTRRALIVTPQTARFQGQTAVRSITMRASGWDERGSQLHALAHLFKDDTQGHRRFVVPVLRSKDGTRYRIDLPWRIPLNVKGDMRSLMIHIDRR